MSALPQKIHHIVVLMLENRSFDHLCGALPGVTGPAGESNKDPDDCPNSVPASFDATPWSPALPDPKNPSRMVGDPVHDFESVTRQIFDEPCRPLSLPLLPPPVPPPAQPPRCRGFIHAARVSGDANADFVAREVMRGFDTPTSLPTITALASAFRVCDRWFSSVPGPTWPNRLFVHAASSFGRVDNKSRLLFNRTTIYDLLEQAGVNWAIYYHDIPHSACFPNLAIGNDKQGRRRMRHVSTFFEDVKAHRPDRRTLPSYIFIEPGYFEAQRSLRGRIRELLKWLGRLVGAPVRPSLDRANDQHPPHDVRLGEHLIADVYDALRANADVWNHCLFVLTYDEHGGLFDHVTPPAVPPAATRSTTPPFAFDRLGLRVPAFLVSPWIRPGVDATAYDHSTIVRTVREHFCPGALALSERDRDAPQLNGEMWTQQVRTDTPSRLARPDPEFIVPSRHDPTQPGLSDLQESLIKLAEAIRPESPLARDAASMAARGEPVDLDLAEVRVPVRTEAEGHALVTQAMERFRD